MTFLRKNINKLDSYSVNILARSYNVLDYGVNLRKMMGSILKDSEIEKISKIELHRIINDILLHNYKGECVLKAKLVEEFIKKEVSAAFEIKVNRSRLDFLTINGDTKSFEIKSELDSLRKLHKQVSDYEKVFELNYVVIDEKHYQGAIQILPNQYGIKLLVDNKIEEIRKATYNDMLDSKMQLELLSKKELTSSFYTTNILEITHTCESAYINNQFKKILKNRYEKKWNFLRQNQNIIFPIDYQFFFNHNICPTDIYES